MVYCTRLRNFIEYFTEMSKVFPLLKCKHTGSVLRELQRGCFPGNITKKGENFEKKSFLQKRENSMGYRPPNFEILEENVLLQKWTYWVLIYRKQLDKYNEVIRSVPVCVFFEIF
ncbi:hypothetical protein T10_13533 [Trichinella papuae]|uniref:Uncharacterized protein n=1 Tax=Trichinella papuae TaxID=268474 RepID=A0A0V1M689_9BILA|nr:hypothetical protein T10_13533 [Trichinella papuae]